MKKLTPQQVLVIEMLCDGKDYDEICYDLEIHIRTLKNHIYAVKKSLGCNTTVQAVLWWLKHKRNGVV